MVSDDPTHRKKVNSKQLELLHILYRFRFATTDQIAAYLGKKNGTRVYRRVMILVEQGYIGRNYEPEYRKQDMPASYFLRSKGIAALKKRDDKTYSQKVLHNIYKDAGASEQFVQSSLTIFDSYNRLKSQYGESLQFFTKSDLAGFESAHFPGQLPDAYIRLNSKSGLKQFFLDVHSIDQPLFKMPKRIKSYIDHLDSEVWSATGEPQPKVLAICDRASTQKRLQSRIAKAKKPELAIFSTLKSVMEKIGESPSIWHPQAKLDESVSLEAI